VLQFLLGDRPGTVWIADVSITRKGHERGPVAISPLASKVARVGRIDARNASAGWDDNATSPTSVEANHPLKAVRDTQTA
jgi:hypothetical protein